MTEEPKELAKDRHSICERRYTESCSAFLRNQSLLLPESPIAI